MVEYIDKIPQFLNNFMKSDYLNIASFTLAIISIALAYIFYKKSKKIIQLNHQSLGYTVIDGVNNFDDLEINYKGEPLESLSITEIIIKNTGTISIKKNDVAPSNHININPAEKTNILACKKISGNNKDNRIKVKIKNNKVCICFDFLNPKDSFLLRVIHTGNSNESLCISGSIIGEKKSFSNNRNKKLLQTGLLGLLDKILKLLISPKLKWARITIDYTVGVLFLSYAFLKNPSPFIMVICLFLGIHSLVSGTKRIFRKRQTFKLDRIEHAFNSQMQDVLSKLKSSMK